jgi:phosphate transport system protein
VQKLLKGAVLSLDPKHRRLAHEVLQQDAVIDQLELAINEECIDLLALRQPMAKDLRFIVSSIRFATDLERIGDLACNVAHRALDLGEGPLIKPLVDIPRMGELANQMLKDTLQAFLQKNPELAERVRVNDHEVDELRTSVVAELIQKMQEQPDQIPRALPLILAARHIERLCDHITNIAEDIIYMVQAKVVRHSVE